jgi:hypothetical protein
MAYAEQSAEDYGYYEVESRADLPIMTAPDWLTFLLDRHLPSIALAIALIVFIVYDLRDAEE